MANPIVRHQNARELLVAQAAPTLGTTNAGPRVGPVVITEIHYHPPDLAGGVDNTHDEFVELFNRAATNVTLFDPAAPANTWQLKGGLGFVFPAHVLSEMPQTFFAAGRVDARETSALQARVVSAFPNVSVVDVTETVSVFSGVMRRLSAIVRFFTWFSIAAGLLIITSSVLATRHVRLRESVYFRILGAKRRFVLRVFAAEHGMIGVSSMVLSLLFAEIGGWILCTQAFKIDFYPFIGALGGMAMAAALLVIVTGLAGTLPVLKKKPAVYLREVTAE